ncbi:DsrE family protein [Alisedimentitalea sp. MJ-SS2]|uniref:DsrE family protein n=1 Tax=Aliisedimentitalea sp. MJ-SS2 TaxID=3049795 RepID=UPI00290A2BF2|nr:DsrE family protein [Alisedimentitalea sp. MJ-SS2]MDU8928866.1 DsrE family protein [Alisedimentitalea sp. MJ-SS2]
MKLIRKLATAFAALTLALSLTLVAGQADAERYGKQKVVYHINYPGGPDDKKYIGAMRNIQNHINAVGADNMDIKVVLHGNGVGILKSAMANKPLQTRIVELKGQNVSVHVCNNTLVGRKIDYDNDLFDVFEEDIVPSGVAELSHLQQQGYTYIKP